jgi:hypothetical protein
VQKLINRPEAFVDEVLEGSGHLPERSAGHEDAGARLIAILLATAAGAA